MTAITSTHDQPCGQPSAPAGAETPAARQQRRPSLLRAAVGFIASVAITIAVMIALATPESRAQRQAAALLLRGPL
jgi:hypothetical protein